MRRGVEKGPARREIDAENGGAMSLCKTGGRHGEADNPRIRRHCHFDDKQVLALGSQSALQALDQPNRGKRPSEPARGLLEGIVGAGHGEPGIGLDGAARRSGNGEVNQQLGGDLGNGLADTAASAPLPAGTR